MSCDGEVITRSFPTSNALFLTSEGTVALLATLGNGIILFAFFRDFKLRRLTNYYIASLALTDLLVGVVGIPLANLTEVAVHEGGNVCLLILCTLIIIHLACIFSLVAVTLDRYLAIAHPVFYIRVMTIPKARGIILSCWLSGAIIGLLPALGWSRECHQCAFLSVMAPSYLVLLYAASVFLPGLVMAVCYGRIYYMILRRSQHADGREVVATRRLSVIVLFFVVCWLPLNTCNIVTSLCAACAVPMPLIQFTVVLYHANSAINPIIYAYCIQDFRNALRSLVCQTLRCRKLGGDLIEEGDQYQDIGIDGPAHSTVDQGEDGHDQPQQQDQHDYHKRDQHKHQEHEQLQGQEQTLPQNLDLLQVNAKNKRQHEKHDQLQNQHQHQEYYQLQDQHQSQKHDQLQDQHQPQKHDQLQNQHQNQKYYQLQDQQQPQRYDQLHDQQQPQQHNRQQDQQQPVEHDQQQDQQQPQKHGHLQDQKQTQQHDQLQHLQQFKKHNQRLDLKQTQKHGQLQDQTQPGKHDQLLDQEQPQSHNQQSYEKQDQQHDQKQD